MYIFLSVSKAVFDLHWSTNTAMYSSFEKNGFVDSDLFYVLILDLRDFKN